MKTLCYRGVPVIGFAAFSGGGKTTMLQQLVPRLLARRIRPAVVKHAHHEFDIDYPGKDSYELRKAGASQVIVGSAHRWAMVMETAGRDEPELTDFLSRIVVGETDLILVEGFRDVKFPKIEIHRKALDRPLFYPRDETVIALVSDAAAEHADSIRSIPLDALDCIADFLVEYRESAIAA